MCRQAARQAGGQYGVQSTCRALPAPLTAGHRLLLGAMNAAHPGPPCLPALPLPCRYSVPRLHLPPKAIAAAKAAGKTPDTFYCLQARSPQSPGLAPPACCLMPAAPSLYACVPASQSSNLPLPPSQTPPPPQNPQPPPLNPPFPSAAARGHRHCDCPRQRLWAGGGNLPPAHHHPAPGAQDCRVHQALPRLPHRLPRKVQVGCTAVPPTTGCRRYRLG